jgi:hypothetical protein
LRGQLLDQVQAMTVGRQQVAPDHGHVGRPVVDHLDEHAVRHVHDDDRDGPAVRARRGVLDGVRDKLRGE